jgi:hypothetical protein
MKNGIQTAGLISATVFALMSLPAHAANCGPDEKLSVNPLTGVEICVSAGNSGLGANAIVNPQSILATLVTQVTLMGLVGGDDNP